ncbi:Toluene efflux pump outer membrane protein TtgI precursor [Thalassovita gelatinovora]|uniref:Toluene efflux pump outer membrane protein TtgI n=1 Tax=Thalassovita gelatinovora TaxID=53501 RepID=A0A0P1FJ58_THAGE|nr:efflux transporter outer membrane subunit [Thalassovita gelatinovora]QIZ82158.1 efflux transporter outer membrane subunit [Thalassovita gelatinovora]CUH67758.1 Toluene efflux pump outer membrane protein TtgI precursor [Thalassovita gelatinovora]SEP68011.1 outer membrane protein, multidrug efflux system [Thalassovita gelatinovora]
MKPQFLLIGLLVAGCAVGPDYQRPEIAMQTRFVGGNAEAVGALASETWWQSYNDRMLSQLVTRGLAQNLDVMSATEAIRQAQAELRATGVNAALDGGLSGSVNRSGGDGLSPTTTHSAELGASFVVDLFGGIRRAREGAAASLTAARADAETTRLAWLAELLSSYADARYYQEVLALTRDTINARKETVEITRSQYEAGAATEYEVAEAQALLSTARAALPQYAALFDANVYAIATLLNEPAGPIMTQMQKGAAQLPTPRGPKSGVPADLLRNRPDLRSAEADLAAAVANVGVAEAALYPSLSLSGTVGRTDGVDAWSFGPQLSFPVFNQAQLRASRDAQVSVAKQSEIAWRASVLGAVEDVQVAQSNLARYRQRAALLRTAANDYEHALTLAQENYRNGAITLLALLETDRNAASARIAAASAVNDAAQAWATLKIATGAGAAVTR